MTKYFEFLEKMMYLFVSMENMFISMMIHLKEKKFLDLELNWIRKNFPNLKITLEHITTKDSVDFVKQHRLIGATVTTHHLLENTYTFFGNHLKPELFCKPIIKNVKHQKALQKVVLSGHKKFFFGSDSAPHLKSKNSQNFVVGVYSTNTLFQILLSFFIEIKNKQI